MKFHRQLAAAGLTVSAFLSSAAVSPVFAQQNAGQWFQNIITGNLNPITAAILFLALAAGVICIVAAFGMMLMRNERNADQYSWGKIGKVFFAGGAFLSISFFINLFANTASEGNADTLPTFGYYQQLEQPSQPAADTRLV